MTDFIPAATILLLRDAPAFEVLMIERHENLSFAGGALVFPGGRIDEGDRNPAWAAHCDGMDRISPEQKAPRIAAIREAFEETGLLLARDETGEMIGDDRARMLDSWRRKVEDDDFLFLELIEKEKLRLACDALHLFARWRPPKAATHRRYDTWFFAAHAPAGQEAREDGNEATEVLWTTPQAAIDAREKGERKMIFPTARNVELLSTSYSAQAVFDFAASRPLDSIEPKIIERDGKRYVTIPEGAGYPVTEETLEKAFRQ